ncbi:TonB-dependent receptor [Maribacter sp.]|uniref:TonB-dependent receptor n=1 Tax=Maribacter sp. TaxID=1897614 RepID=UPI0025B825E5|nr:TonB-dependent receptor [Maribacter sp.]
MKRITLSLLMAMLYFSAFSQNTLKGIITNSENKDPLMEVSIYISKLDKGTISNENGSYEFTNLPNGKFIMVVSYLGFQTITKTVVINTPITTLNMDMVPSAIEMEEVIVSTPFHKLQSENVMKIERQSIQKMKEQGTVTLSQGITSIPGVEIVSTGLGIGKPVIRGLSSNRVLVYTQGIRLENQQFGDEHGLGISDSGIESVEVIKGPASLLYGSDALGGVLYINPEKFAAKNKTFGNANYNYYTNTRGSNSNIGIKTSGDKLKFLIRAGIASHIDYKTGDGDRVTNSRFKEKDIKTGLGYQNRTFKTELRYNYNISELGIAEEIGEQSTSRKANAPYQEITSHILSSKNNFFFKNSSLEAILGYTANNRKEFEDHEGNGEIETALEMDLETWSYNLQYHLPHIGIVETIAGIQGMHQTNSNSGEEILIPDAITNDIGILLTSHIHFNTNGIQLGVRYDHRSLSSETHGIPSEEGYIAGLNKDFPSFNASLGYKTNLGENNILRINLASGFRAPNLAELSSNGVHEGTNRYEVGNSTLNNEKNLQVDIAYEYKNKHIEFYANGFYNNIADYIYLAPNGQVIDSDNVFTYLQQDATLYGAELGFHLHPHPLDWLHIESSYASVIGEDGNDANLPLIPANNWTNTLRVEMNKDALGITKGYVFATLKSYFKQDKVSNFETPTDNYNILNLGIGNSITIFKLKTDLRLSADNLLNTNYISHLSRLKGDGVSNMGRNINLGITLSF